MVDVVVVADETVVVVVVDVVETVTTALRSLITVSRSS